VRLNDPDVVRDQYANERNLRARQSIYDDFDGEHAPDFVFRTIAELRPRRVLEVGGGPGELAGRLVDELGVELAFVDQSERMVDLARERGLEAEVGDVQNLPFRDASFDTAVAAWMLYHVPDLDRALAELARVLEPGGHLVAVTNGRDHLRELRDVMGHDFTSSFTRENGTSLLSRHFREVQRLDKDGLATIHERETVVAYRDSMMTSDKRHDLVFDVPFRTHTRMSVFVCSP
jgi:ubiquinone/menaquinone biosynthesis C-methylase UbiE